ncbi:MAG: hypothetical protein H6970_00520 [Gammaproteobacteria bacterium]|nr:hypothetical protein [Gammaproteobacteria bacterium]MCP5423543.1 hypothetical protein [Gammaproteobacteria bacterium]
MLQISDLQPADILLSTGDAKVSKVIRVGTISRYSHASLFIGNGQIIEALGVGVIQQSLTDAMSDDTLVAVYRRVRMTPEQAQEVIRYAKRQIGKKYDYSGAAGAGITSGPGIVMGTLISPLVVVVGIGADLYNRHNPEAAFFCSELVALAFDKAGVPLGTGGPSSTPKDLSVSHVLSYLGDLKNTA